MSEPEMVTATHVKADTHIEIDTDSPATDEGEVAVAFVTGETAVVLVGDPHEVERVIVDADTALHREQAGAKEAQPKHVRGDE
jgi:hypothetical protein